MVDPKLMSVAEELLERSAKGEVAWQPTVSSNEFIVFFPDYSLIVHRQGYTQGVDDFGLSLTNEKGTKIDSIISEAPDEEGYSTLQQLFELARAEALGISKRLDSVLAALDEEGRIGTLGEQFA